MYSFSVSLLMHCRGLFLVSAVVSFVVFIELVFFDGGWFLRCAFEYCNACNVAETGLDPLLI